MHARCRLPLLAVEIFLLFTLLTSTRTFASLDSVDPEATLDCHRRAYSHKVTQYDSEGRMCWDIVTVMSCWGRCDSNEISDWRFPYKRSFHPVCIHGSREPRIVTLSNCDLDADPGTSIHEYLEAMSCTCTLCRSSEASCEGLRYLGQRDSLGFQRG